MATTSEVPACPSQDLLDAKRNTYWSYEIICIEGDRKRSLVIPPATTLAEAMAGGVQGRDLLHRRLRLQDRPGVRGTVQGV